MFSRIGLLLKNAIPVKRFPIVRYCHGKDTTERPSTQMSSIKLGKLAEAETSKEPKRKQKEETDFKIALKDEIQDEIDEEDDEDVGDDDDDDVDSDLGDDDDDGDVVDVDLQLNAIAKIKERREILYKCIETRHFVGDDEADIDDDEDEVDSFKFVEDEIQTFPKDFFQLSKRQKIAMYSQLGSPDDRFVMDYMQKHQLPTVDIYMLVPHLQVRRQEIDQCDRKPVFPAIIDDFDSD